MIKMLDSELINKILVYTKEVNTEDILLALAVSNGLDIEDIINESDKEFCRLLRIPGAKNSSLPKTVKYRLLNDLLYCLTNEIKPAMADSNTVQEIVRGEKTRNTFIEELGVDECEKQILSVVESEDLDEEMCKLALEMGTFLQTLNVYLSRFIIALPIKYKNWVRQHKDNEFKGCTIGYEESIHNTFDMLEIMLGCICMKTTTITDAQTVYCCTVLNEINNGMRIPIKIPKVIQGTDSFNKMKYENRVMYNNFNYIFKFEDDGDITWPMIKVMLMIVGHVSLDRVDELKGYQAECKENAIYTVAKGV